MPYEVGGRADKEGNRYEIKYSILKILEVIEEKIDYVVLEAIGDDEQGVDIWIGKKDGSKEGQQCKGRNGSKDSWDYGSANSKNIFENWKAQLDRDLDVCVSLVTPIAFQDLVDLLTRANNSNEIAEDFYNYQIKSSSTKFQGFYKNFCQVMNLNINNNKDIQKSIYYLKRIFFHQIPDSYLREMILQKISYLFSGDEKNIYAQLIAWIIDGDILGKRINIGLIRQFIEMNNLQFKNLSLDRRIAPRIEQLNREYRDNFQSLNSSLIERNKYKDCYKLIDENDSMIIHGKAGMGKSGTTEAIIRYCELKRIPYLAIKLDKRLPNVNARKWGEELELPDSIVHCLHSISKNEKAVLILDQLDALRWTLAHSRGALLVCSEIIEQINHLNRERDHKISIVMVCRTIDFENDNNIRNLFKKDDFSKTFIEWHEMKIEELEDSEVEEIIGERYQTLTPKLKSLLKIPSNLFIWCQLDKAKTYDECLSTNHLIEQWWEQLLSSYSKQGHSPKELDNFKKELVNKFLELERIYVPRRFFSGNKDELDFVASNGFINISDNKISFAHQSILDFLLSEKMLDGYFEGIPMNEILGNKELQTPGKRYQLQMLMQSLLEIDSADFIEVGKQLLKNTNIRFFNKYVFFEILRDIDVIDTNIKRFILSYCEDKEWKDHLLNNVIYSKVPYYKLLLNNGIVQKWLGEDENKDYAISLITSISPEYDSEDIMLIKQFIFFTEEYSRRFATCFPYDLSKDVDEMFDLRLQLYERYPDLNHYYMDFKSDLKQHEFRTIKYLAFLMENKLRGKIHQFKKFESEIFIEDNEFLIEHGEEVFNELIKFLPLENNSIYELSEWSAKHHKDSIERIIVKILIKAINSIIKSNPTKFKEIIIELSVNSNDILNELILNGLSNLCEDFSDYAIEFIIENFEDRIFISSIGDGDELSLVKKIIQKHSISCNQQLFRVLEDTIIGYVSKDAKDYLKYRINHNKENKGERVYWSFWGDLQLELLTVLPIERLSHKSVELLRVLKRRFNGESTRYKYYLGHGGFVSSPVSGKKLSTYNWTGIITKKKEDFITNERWREVPGGFIESSIRQFASSFAEAVRNSPLEMINLVLNNKKSVSEEFIDALYNGLASCDLIGISNDLLEILFAEFPSDFDSYRAQNICRIIERSQIVNWSDNTLEMLMDIAVNHNNPNIENPVITSTNDKKMGSFDLLYSNSLNCVRGCAARALEHLLWENDLYYDLFKPTIISLTKDSNPAVRLATIYTLRPVINIDRDWALNKILELYREDFRLAGHVNLKDIFFLSYMENRELVLDTILKCFYSEDKDLIKIGAYALAEMNLIHKEYKEVVKEFQFFSQDQVEPYLEMVVIYFDKDRYNERCKEIMLAFKDADYDFELAFSKLFYENLIKLDRDYEFLIKLMQSKGSKRLLYSFVKYLDEENRSLVDYGEVILSLSTNLIDNFNQTERNPWGIESELSKLIIGLYDETCKSEDPKLQRISNESLNLWDRMFELRIGSIRALSNEIMAR